MIALHYVLGYPTHQVATLRDAVRRLEVGEVEEWGFRVQRPDLCLAHQIEELADACGPRHGRRHLAP